MPQLLNTVAQLNDKPANHYRPQILQFYGTARDSLSQEGYTAAPLNDEPANC
jgi:hypothetical protein